MIQYKTTADVVIPAFKNKSGHPVLFNPQVISKIKVANNPDSRMDKFFRTFKVKNIESKESGILANINTQEDYDKAGF